MKTRETLSNLAFFFFSFSAPRRARDNNTILFSTICDKTSGHSKLGRDEKRSTTIIIIILSSVVTHRNFIDCRRFSFFFILNVDHCCTHNSIYYIQSRFIVPPKSRPIFSFVFENTSDDFITDVITIIIIALRHGVRAKLSRPSGSCRRRALRKRIFTECTPSSQQQLLSRIKRNNSLLRS